MNRFKFGKRSCSSQKFRENIISGCQYNGNPRSTRNFVWAGGLGAVAVVISTTFVLSLIAFPFWHANFHGNTSHAHNDSKAITGIELASVEGADDVSLNHAHDVFVGDHHGQENGYPRPSKQLVFIPIQAVRLAESALLWQKAYAIVGLEPSSGPCLYAGPRGPPVLA